MHEINNDSVRETCVLVGLDTGEFDAESSMAELERLTESADGFVAATAIQSRARPEDATYLGLGKLAEIRQLCETHEATLIIVDGMLTPSQERNIEQLTGVRTIDRVMLILDIFALHAKTNEGKTQVELAQLKHLLPRLGGKGTAMSRLGGGIGTRGPGETQLETDRRHIRQRIRSLEQKLAGMKKQRALVRDRRRKNGAVTVSLVGYTNAGKSTLMNALTDAGVLTQDKLFATLDPTARALRLPDGHRVILTDTVGFISRLPHELVEAFKSTLEELCYADLIVVVCDASDPDMDAQRQVTADLIRQLGAEATPVLTVYNKCDLVPGLLFLDEGRGAVCVSAKTGKGLDELLDTIAKMLGESRMQVRLLLPYSEGSFLAEIRIDGAVLSESYEADGVLVEAILDARTLAKLEPYILPDDGNDE